VAVDRGVSFDELLARPEVVARIRQAEQDLPDDTWKAGGEAWPVIRNVSRYERETELAHELLRSVSPRFKKLSATGLIHSLKTSSASVTEPKSGVAYQVYLAGNLALMKELESRRKAELEGLRGLQGDERVIFGGDAGRPLAIGVFIRLRLLND
jgi:hypothetical protein